jgi:hypothetical protein
VDASVGGNWCDDHFCYDAFVTKLNPTGSTLIYSTYLGGSFDEAFSYGNTGDIAIDPAGHAYVTGWTESLDFPVHNAIQPYFKVYVDVFVSKLTPDGSAFIYSTYLAGQGGQVGRGIAADGAGHAYVTGFSSSPGFPTTPGSFQPVKNGESDAFVSKIEPDGSALAYSTFLGGENSDHAGSIAVDVAGSVFVSGVTISLSFPTKNAFQASYGGSFGDAFISKLRPSGDSLAYSSYLGGGSDDSSGGLAIDRFGNAYLTGTTRSMNFPIIRPFQSSFGGGYWDSFVTKVSRFGRHPVADFRR